VSPVTAPRRWCSRTASGATRTCGVTWLPLRGELSRHPVRSRWRWSSDSAAYDRAKYGTLDGYARDVLDICEELGLEDVIFVGHSVSAMIGVLAAARAPARFEALVLIGPSPRTSTITAMPEGFRVNIEELLSALDSNYRGWSAASLDGRRGVCPHLASEPSVPSLSASPPRWRRAPSLCSRARERRCLRAAARPPIRTSLSRDARAVTA
jgi:pimeloyl-ACP methyl ester carboxylesterase